MEVPALDISADDGPSPAVYLVRDLWIREPILKTLHNGIPACICARLIGEATARR